MPILELTDGELVRLRELAARQDRPWWRDYPLMVSLLAFLLSLITATVSAYSGYRKDVHEQQAQLSSNIQKLQDLLFKQVEVYDKYKNTPFEGTETNLISQQVNTTLRNAAELAERLGSDATTSEFTTVAAALYDIGDQPRSRKLLEMALRFATNANEESIALRKLGFLKIRSSNPTEIAQGNDLFMQALKLDSKYPLAQVPDAIIWLKAAAEFEWAAALAAVSCEEARPHFMEGLKYLDSANPSPAIDQMHRVVNSQATTGIGAVPTCKLATT